MIGWRKKVGEPEGTIPPGARPLLIWGGIGIVGLSIGWSVWQDERVQQTPPPNPAEAQPPPAPDVIEQADLGVRRSLRELDDAERIEALRTAEQRLRQQRQARAVQQTVREQLRNPGAPAATEGLPLGEYEPPDVVEEEIRQTEARRKYESLRAPQIVRAASREPAPPPSGSAQAAPTASGEGPSASASGSALERVYDSLARAIDDPEKLRLMVGQASTAGPGPGQAPPGAPSGGPQPPRLETPSDPEGWERIYEGEFLECVLVTQLRGDFPGPANAMVAVDHWSRDRQRIVVPRGSRVLGTASAVSTWGQARLAVAFHRLILPRGSFVSLDRFAGLNQVGETGLKDLVNNHYLSVFGSAAAVGVLSGLTMRNTTVYGPADERIRAGAGAAMAQQGVAIMERFLNRMPTITIRAGHRVRVYFTSDILVPRPGRHSG